MKTQLNQEARETQVIRVTTAAKEIIKAHKAQQKASTISMIAALLIAVGTAYHTAVGASLAVILVAILGMIMIRTTKEIKRLTTTYNIQ